MPPTGVLTDSYTNCLICGARNASDNLQCRDCFAPMALVHEALAQNRMPQIVSVIGDSNVGKTVYLGFLLDMLAQHADDFVAVPRGAYSVDLQQSVISHMAYRMFPPKTPVEADQWNWAYYQVSKQAAKSRLKNKQPKIVDLVMPDMAGEAIAAELASPKTFKIVRSLLEKSTGLILLVDAAQAGNGSAQPDFFALKMMSHLDSLYGENKNTRIDMPIAVVLTKADYFPECFDDPRRFAAANLNRLAHIVENRFAKVEFFACSVVGSLAYATAENEDFVIPVPLHTALRGVMEPFAWIVQQL